MWFFSHSYSLIIVIKRMSVKQVRNPLLTFEQAFDFKQTKWYNNILTTKMCWENQ